MPKYRVLTGLTYPPPAIVKRLLDGETIPMERRQLRRADVGEVVSDIPSTSVDWLLEQGKIERVSKKPAPAVKGGTDGEA